MKVPTDTLGWAQLTRYADYRALYPWLERNYTPQTLDRIDAAWERVPEDKKRKQKEEQILDFVRQH